MRADADPQSVAWRAALAEGRMVGSTVESSQRREGEVFLSGGRGQGFQHFVKRVMDKVVAASALVIVAPLFALVAVAVKITSLGPVLYRWPVVGMGGRYFTSYKFRTMVAGADRLKEHLLPLNEMMGPVFKLKNDPRVTPVGRLLRKFSIDELPQLWSVLKGDMSLVGPRPPLQSEYALFTSWQKQKLLVKPGITCLWQISGRNDVADFDQWVRLDLAYIQNWSLWLDIKILLKTIPAVLFARGAA